jgi:hypothetical protein
MLQDSDRSWRFSYAASSARASCNCREMIGMNLTLAPGKILVAVPWEESVFWILSRLAGFHSQGSNVPSQRCLEAILADQFEPTLAIARCLEFFRTNLRSFPFRETRRHFLCSIANQVTETFELEFERPVRMRERLIRTVKAGDFAPITDQAF